MSKGSSKKGNTATTSKSGNKGNKNKGAKKKPVAAKRKAKQALASANYRAKQRAAAAMSLTNAELGNATAEPALSFNSLHKTHVAAAGLYAFEKAFRHMINDGDLAAFCFIIDKDRRGGEWHRIKVTSVDVATKTAVVRRFHGDVFEGHGVDTINVAFTLMYLAPSDTASAAAVVAAAAATSTVATSG